MSNQLIFGQNFVPHSKGPPQKFYIIKFLGWRRADRLQLGVDKWVLLGQQQAMSSAETPSPAQLPVLTGTQTQTHAKTHAYTPSQTNTNTNKDEEVNTVNTLHGANLPFVMLTFQRTVGPYGSQIVFCLCLMI